MTTKTRRRALFILAAAASLPSSAAGQETAVHLPLRYDTPIDLTVTGVGAVLWISSEVAKDNIAPAFCRWCEHDAAGNSTVNALDQNIRTSLKWRNTGAADVGSSLSGFLLAPVALLSLDAIASAHDHVPSAFWSDTLVITESVVIAADVTQLVKFVVGRERPFVHVLSPEEKKATAQPSDNNASFFSGHTSGTFALASAAGTVASLHDYRYAPIIWATGLTAATFTGYLRIAADRHYFTDVITGAVVGSLVGFAVPYLFHRPATEAAPTASPAALTGRLSAPTPILFSGVW